MKRLGKMLRVSELFAEPTAWVAVRSALGPSSLSPKQRRSGRHNLSMTPIPLFYPREWTNTCLQTSQRIQLKPANLRAISNQIRRRQSDRSVCECVNRFDDTVQQCRYSKIDCTFENALVRRHFAANLWFWGQQFAAGTLYLALPQNQWVDFYEDWRGGMGGRDARSRSAKWSRPTFGLV